MALITFNGYTPYILCQSNRFVKENTKKKAFDPISSRLKIYLAKEKRFCYNPQLAHPCAAWMQRQKSVRR